MISRYKKWASLGAVVLILALLTVGCRAASPKGWAGVTQIDDTLIYTSVGRIWALDTAANPLNSIALQVQSSSGFFSCGTSLVGVPVYGTPVAGNRVVFISRYNGIINAFSIVDGKLVEDDKGNNNKGKWQTSVPANIIGGLTLASGTLYFGTADGTVYALDAEKGTIKWSYPTGNKIWSTPAVDSQHVYVTSFDKKLHAINISDGKEAWVVETKGAISETPLVDNGTVYFGSYDRTFYAVDAATGKIEWQFPTEGSGGANNWYWAQPVTRNGVVYAPNLDGRVYALNVTDGTLVNTYDLRGGTSYQTAISSNPVVVGDTVIIAATNLAKPSSTFYAIDTAQKAEPRKIAQVQAQINSPLFASDGTLYVHTTLDKLFRINITSGDVKDITPVLTTK